MIWLSLLVFLAAAAYDWCAAFYIKATERDASAMAATWGVLQTAIGVVCLAGILGVSRWLFIPDLLGVWCGTFFAIEYRKWRARRNFPAARVVRR